MNKEERKLLHKDLCSRLSHGVKVDVSAWDSTSEEECIRNWGMTKQEINALRLNPMFFYNKDLPKPYLRPISSMTEEEQKEFVGFHCVNLCPIVMGEMLTLENETRMFDWLNEHHFDYRGLIDKGLALVAPDEMYKSKEGGDK